MHRPTTVGLWKYENRKARLRLCGYNPIPASEVSGMNLITVCIICVPVFLNIFNSFLKMIGNSCYILCTWRTMLTLLGVAVKTGKA